MSEPSSTRSNVIQWPWGASPDAILRVVRLFGWEPPENRKRPEPFPIVLVCEGHEYKRSPRGRRPKLRVLNGGSACNSGG